MPASTPTSSAAGTITAKAQNIRMPVSFSRPPMMLADLVVGHGGKPQVPLQQPAEGRRLGRVHARVDAAAGHRPVIGLPRPARHHAQPFAVAHDHRAAIAVAVEPGGDLGIGHARVALRLREFSRLG
jgi:hypothetical protein